MSDFKEFQGKNLDEAIENACDYFNLKRDRLEIEIIGGGSTGIFGIMGVKKAMVKARPRAQVSTTDILNGENDREQREAAPRGEERKPEPKVKPAPRPDGEGKKTRRPEPVPERQPDPDRQPAFLAEEPENEINGNVDPAAKAPRKPRERKPRPDGQREGQRNGQRSEKPRQDRPRSEKPRQDRVRSEKPRQDRVRNGDRPERGPREAMPREPIVRDMDEFDDQPRANMADFDPVILEKTVHEVMVQLLTPIIGETKLDITLESDRVKVFIDDEENSGLIIGREGQTLSSIQYLVNRLVSRKMEASVRIQVDTGDYRERQDDKLRQVAWHLAEKAGSMGRTQSTKPLSSYHRRVVHLALQDNEDVFTRSKGDGPMKRVLIVPKARRNGNRSSRD